MTSETINRIAMVLPLLLQLMGLAIAVSTDRYIGRLHRRVMLVIIALAITMLGQNVWEYYLTVGPPRIMLRTAVAAYGYSLRPVILVLFCYVVAPRRRYWPLWALAGFNGVVYLSAFFSPLSFHISENNLFQSGPLRYTCHIISFLLLAYLLYLMVRTYPSDGKGSMTLPLFAELAIIGSVLLDSKAPATQYVSFLTIAVASGCVFYYIWLHLQFVRAHERALRAEQRIQIMMTQIQPHFLFNTIATFRALCRRDPEQAAQVAEKFSLYLRQNLDSLNAPGLIPFEKELEHTRQYADIEMVRFENVRMEYVIEDRGFSLPPLTVQPLVENAIRHGVRIREDGVVRVSTRLLEDCHEITVRDNGIGFDVSAVETAEGKHIGIRNVRERIESLCRGTLTISSVPDEGTIVTIRIPRKETDP